MRIFWWILIIIIAFLGITIGLGYLIKNWIGDIRPVIFPAKNINQIDSTKGKELGKKVEGERLTFPLKMDDGFKISVFAKGVDGARDLQILEEGIMLLSQTSQGKVVGLFDRDKDGKAEEIRTLLANLNNPHGLAFFQDKLYLAEEDKVSRYNFLVKGDQIEISKEKELFKLPLGVRHSTRSLVFDNDGKMYISVGSSCDTCNEADPFLGSVLVSDAEGRSPKIYARGLRNAVFLARQPDSNNIWVTEMGRDFLGDNAPPDEINILKDNGDFGWPYCYGDKRHDDSFDKNFSKNCNDTISPVFNIQAHSAPLGLVFIDSDKFGNNLKGDLLVAYHGSWNRSSPVGYKVVRLSIEGDRVVKENDFITGFLPLGGSQALGRPVDMEFDLEGNLYLSDDKAGVVYLITYE